MDIMDEESMVEAAKKISETFGCATLVKGGHQINDANILTNNLRLKTVFFIRLSCDI